MKCTLGFIAGAVALCVVGASPATAQMAPRNFERGPVTLVQQVEVKPGQLNAYMQDLQHGWRVSMEAQKRAGDVLSYSIAQPVDARTGEPNLYLIVTYRNMAALDRPLADNDKNTVAVFGSLNQAHEAGMKREALRTSKGSMLLQDLEFAK